MILQKIQVAILLDMSGYLQANWWVRDNWVYERQFRVVKARKVCSTDPNGDVSARLRFGCEGSGHHDEQRRGSSWVYNTPECDPSRNGISPANSPLAFYQM